MRNKCQKKLPNNNFICFCLWCYKQSKNSSNSIWESVTSTRKAEYKTLRLHQRKYLTARSKNPKKNWTTKSKLLVLHEFLWNSLYPFSVPRLLLPYFQMNLAVQSVMKTICGNYLRCVRKFSSICTIKKTWKTPMEECYF